MRRRGSFGFTLVELLAVIGIISVLAGMLLPALDRALGESRKTFCMNNLKQYAIGNNMYAGEFNDYIFNGDLTSYVLDGRDRQHCLNVYMYRIMGYFPAPRNYTAANKGDYYYIPVPYDVTLCPEVKTKGNGVALPSDYNTSPNGPLSSGAFYATHYGMNAVQFGHLNKNESVSGWLNLSNWRRANMYSKPAQLVMQGEYSGAYDVVQLHPLDASNAFHKLTLAFRHPAIEFTLLNFLDGGARSYSVSTMRFDPNRPQF